MATSKRKFNFDLEKITSGVDIKDTVKSINEAESTHITETKEPRNFKKIPLKKLRTSPINGYPIVPEEVAEMENLLILYGLLEPFNVTYDEDTDTYEIESGNKRYHALQNLYTKYETNAETENRELYEKNVRPLYKNGIYCMVEDGPSDEDSKRERIIIHNETNRPFDPIRTSSKLAELAEIYSRKNATLPAGQKLNVNEKIASELKGKYGVRQIIRYKNFDALIDELKEAAVKYNLNISTVSTYHVLSEPEQTVLTQYINDCYSSGRVAELPTVAEVKSIVAAELSAETEQTQEQESSETTSNIEVFTPPSSAPDFIKNDEHEQQQIQTASKSLSSESLSDLKSRAAKKILESKDKKETKIKDAVGTLQKKSTQLEKIIMSYITEETEPQLNLDELLNELDEIAAKINSIKQTLKK